MVPLLCTKSFGTFFYLNKNQLKVGWCQLKSLLKLTILKKNWSGGPENAELLSNLKLLRGWGPTLISIQHYIYLLYLMMVSPCLQNIPTFIQKKNHGQESARISPLISRENLRKRHTHVYGYRFKPWCYYIDIIPRWWSKQSDINDIDHNNTEHVVSLIKVSHEYPMWKTYTAQGSNMGCIWMAPLDNNRNHFASTVLVGRHTIVTAANSKNRAGIRHAISVVYCIPPLTQ